MKMTQKVYLCILSVALLQLSIVIPPTNAFGYEFYPDKAYADDRSKYCPNENCDIDQDCFRAAVFEYDRIDTNSCADSTFHNLQAYKQGIELAAQDGAKIIVLPEDGLYTSSPLKFITPCLEELPDPDDLNSSNDNPCNQPHLYGNLTILTELSCTAKKNNIYIVANFGSKQSCKPGTKVGESVCPQIGYFALNTDVVLDSNGRFIKRYRKYNIFTEVFDKAPELEVVYFDTPMGRFGVFTCFDMIFQKPAVELVEKYDVDTILFPTWWFDELPLLSAIQFQDGWSWTNRVNLLAANILKLRRGSIGSGIYSGGRFHYAGADHGNSKVLMANIPKKPRDDNMSTKCNALFVPETLDYEPRQMMSEYRYKNYTLEETDEVRHLSEVSDTVHACTRNGSFCCKIFFEFEDWTKVDTEILSRLIMIVRDAPRSGVFNFYEQVCALVSIEAPLDSIPLNEIKFSSKPLAKFKRLSVEASYNHKHVYPIAAHSLSSLISREHRRFGCDEKRNNNQTTFTCHQEYSHSKPSEILTLGLYGRYYEGDIIKS